MRVVSGFVVAGLLLVACGDDGEDDGSREVLVLAASSLTDAFTEVEAAFEEANPDVDVVLTFDSSSTLAAQVAEGGPGDVLATADERTMATAVESGAVHGEPEVVATNRGVIAVPAGSGVVTTPEDLEGDVTLAVCAPEVPCRLVAEQLFDALGIEPEIDTEEENVSAVLTKLEAGEVDAGVVYATDDLASDAIEALDLGEVVVSTDYPVVAVSDDEAAQAFVDFVTGPEGRAILAGAGFTAAR
jgi:molybdate transport system substrate-binding protein